MARQSLLPRDQILVKGYGFLSFSKNMAIIFVRIKVKMQVVNTVQVCQLCLRKFLIISEAFTNENSKEIPKERYISSEERRKTIDNIRSFIIV